MFDREEISEFIGDLSYDASGGDNVKTIAKTLRRSHPEMADYLGRGLENFIINMVGALDVGRGMKTARKYEKLLYKNNPEFEDVIEAFLSYYSDMEMEGEGPLYYDFWVNSKLIKPRKGPDTSRSDPKLYKETIEAMHWIHAIDSWKADWKALEKAFAKEFRKIYAETTHQPGNFVKRVRNFYMGQASPEEQVEFINSYPKIAAGIADWKAVDYSKGEDNPYKDSTPWHWKKDGEWYTASSSDFYG